MFPPRPSTPSPPPHHRHHHPETRERAGVAAPPHSAFTRQCSPPTTRSRVTHSRGYLPPRRATPHATPHTPRPEEPRRYTATGGLGWRTAIVVCPYLLISIRRRVVIICDVIILKISFFHCCGVVFSQLQIEAQWVCDTKLTKLSPKTVA